MAKLLQKFKNREKKDENGDVSFLCFPPCLLLQLGLAKLVGSIQLGFTLWFHLG